MPSLDDANDKREKWRKERKEKIDIASHFSDVAETLSVKGHILLIMKYSHQPSRKFCAKRADRKVSRGSVVLDLPQVNVNGDKT